MTRPSLVDAYIAPRSEVEKAVADLWARILKVEQVGMEDNFFELGGHSLLATQIVSRMRDAFRVEISLRQFFESPTVSGIASAIARKQADIRQTGGEYGHNAASI
jgi:acyl carrier protein